MVSFGQVTAARGSFGALAGQSARGNCDTLDTTDPSNIRNVVSTHAHDPAGSTDMVA